MWGWRQSSGSDARAGSPLRVMLAIPSYRGGGAERVVTTLARRLSRERFEVHLTVAQDEGPLGKTLPDDVVQHHLNCSRISRAAWPLLRLVRRIQPDILLTAASHLNTLAGWLKPLLPARTHLVIRETGVLETSLASWKLGRMLKPTLAAAYRQADRVIGQSTFATHEIHTHYGVCRERLRRIANPVEVDLITPELRNTQPSPFLGAGPHVLCVGRLGSEKGFDRAIAAWPALRATHSSAQLWILGEGQERSALMRQAEQAGIMNSVHFPGFQPDIPRWMAHSDLFVLSSRTESLPNVLLEAIAAGCPVVTLQPIGGTQELLEELGLGDRWIPSLETWSAAWFQRPEPEIRERLTQRFHWQRIVSQYEQMLEEVVRGVIPLSSHPGRRVA